MEEAPVAESKIGWIWKTWMQTYTHIYILIYLVTWEYRNIYIMTMRCYDMFGDFEFLP